MTADDYGRVGEDGTVFVRTADGERAVGSYPGATPEEALAYFSRKYDDISAQISLFAQRLNGIEMPTRDIEAGIKRLREATAEPNVVGDLAALTTRVDALAARAGEKRAEASAAKAAVRAEHLQARAALVEEAEKIAATPVERVQWRTDGQRMESCSTPGSCSKGRPPAGPRARGGALAPVQPRPDDLRPAPSPALRAARVGAERGQDDQAGAGEGSRGSVHLQGLGADLGGVQAVDGSLEGGRPRLTQGRRRAVATLPRRPGHVLRRAQRRAVAEEEEFKANLAAKEALLVEAEAILPIRDLAAAKESLRHVQERWEDRRQVPRADVDRVEQRIQRVEKAVRDAEEERWKRTNPEGRARAQSTVDQLEEALAAQHIKLEKAQAKGDGRAVAEAEASIEARPPGSSRPAQPSRVRRRRADTAVRRRGRR